MLGEAVKGVQKVEMRRGGSEEKSVREADEQYKRNEQEVLVHKQELWENNLERERRGRWLSDSHIDSFNTSHTVH